MEWPIEKWSELDPKQAVWIIRKILKAKETVAQAGYNHEEFVQSRSFRIKTMYNALRGNLPKVSWERLECNNFGYTQRIDKQSGKSLPVRHVHCVKMTRNPQNIYSSNAHIQQTYGRED
ncbi:hypothetical protein KY285_005264 [Solanum tuberosum]|nr:hypothetical protein KY285_005264 [Solanum tuberosum]